jgi:hypothetical protein
VIQEANKAAIKMVILFSGIIGKLWFYYLISRKEINFGKN